MALSEYLEVSFFIISGWGGSYSSRMCNPSRAPSRSALSFFAGSVSRSSLASAVAMDSVERFWLPCEKALVRMRSVSMEVHSSEVFLERLVGLTGLRASSLMSSMC